MVKHFGLCVLLLLLSSIAFGADVTPSINYQARLTTAGGQPLSGLHTLGISIYAGGSPGGAGTGTLQYTETVQLNLVDGIVNYQIGSTSGSLESVDFIIGVAYYVEVSVDSPSNVILPRTLMSSVPFARRAWRADSASSLDGLYPSDFAPATHNHDGVYLKLNGTACVIVEPTDSPTTNGERLLAAYAQAKTLTPNGQAPSTTNRAALIVSPGRYDLTTAQLTLDTEFVDLVGLTNAPENQYIVGLGNGVGTGVLSQTAADVQIRNLHVHCALQSGNPFDVAAYNPTSTSTATLIKNCVFSANGLFASSMNPNQQYNGTYEQVTGGPFAFGGSGLGVAGGTFTDCVGANFSFGSGGVASGTFTNCKGGLFAFGSAGLSLSGTFINCEGGQLSFGSAANSSSGTITGTFINCRGGDQAFGAVGPMGGTANATGAKFMYCRGGPGSFPVLGSPTLIYCINNNAPYP